MSEIKKLKRNSFLSFLTNLSRFGANVLVFWIIARYLGVLTFGQFVYAHTVATTFILLADFGFDLLLTTEIARNRNKVNEIFQQYFSIKLFLSIAAFLGNFVLIFLQGPSTAGFQISLLFSLFVIFTTMTNFLSALFRGFEKLEYETIVSLISNLSLIVVVVLLLFVHPTVVTISIFFVLSRFIGLFFGLCFSFMVLPEIKYSLNFNNFRESIRKTAVFGLLILFANLLFQLDTILLGLLKNEYEVGVYQAAVKLIMLPMIIPQIFFNAFLPTLTRLNKENEEAWKKYGYLLNKIFLWCSLPIAVIFYVYSKEIIKLVYNYPDDNGSVIILKIFSAVLFIRFFLETYGYMLITSMKQKDQLEILILVTILNFVLNLAIIPRFGSEGAAYVALFSTFILTLGYCYKTFPLVIDWVLDLRTFFVLTFSVVFLYLFYRIVKINFIIGVPLILIVFLIIGLSFYFTKEERELIIRNKLKG